MQLYMVCPECLQKDGKKALLDRKLAVNATRLFGMGHYAMRVGQYSADWSGYCMKQSKGFSVAELRAWAPLKDRGFPDVPQGVTKPAPGRCLIPDGKGNMIPDHPGEVIPLTELPDDHPAVHYLKSRRFDIQSLTVQFRVGYCVRDAPENGEIDRYYKRLPCGFRDTPQNRIIFYADVKGVQRGWQARILEQTIGDIKFYLHPYTNQWTPMEFRNPATGAFEPLPHVAAEPVKWKPSKYKTAFSSERNEMLMGFDAAVRWNQLMKLISRNSDMRESGTAMMLK